MKNNRQAFTLIEIMMALILMTLASTMIYLTFSTVIKAWRRGTKLSEDLHHGDFVMDQLVLGLRSAYFPDGGNVKGYGFWLEDRGSAESAADSISWVKQGTALTDSNSPVVAGPHRIQFSIETDEHGQPAAAVKFWRPYAQVVDFDASKLDFQFISSRVRGFDCRVATNTTASEWEWSDTWEDEDTNTLPQAVELTLYLEPLDKDRPPVELRRCVEIPVWGLSGASRK
jgi:prepilin-type N-terminal cleavage/methylation domain-containing protein